MDQLVDASLEHERLVDRGLERDRDAGVGSGDGPTVLAGPLDEHLVGAELVPGGAEAPVAELLELARLKRRAHRAELLAELRPEDGQVRLHAQLRVDVPELDLLHPQLLGDLVGVGGGEGRTLDDDPAQRLPQLEARRGARLVAERDDASQLGDLGEQSWRRASAPRASRRGRRSRARPRRHR